MRLCAPGYIYPTLLEFDILVDTLVRGDVVVCNVENGPGSYEPDAPRFRAWQMRVQQIHAKGATAVGYVPLGWFDPQFQGQKGRPKDYAELLQWCNNWSSWFGVAGIWFDEMTWISQRVSLPILQGLHGAARRTCHPNPLGLYPLGLSMWNPGNYPAHDQDDTYHDWLNRLPGSLWCTFEGRASEFLALLPRPVPPSNASREIYLVYECRPDQIIPVRNHAWATNVAYGSLTADGGDGNPYDTAASRLSSL